MPVIARGLGDNLGRVAAMKHWGELLEEALAGINKLADALKNDAKVEDEGAS